MTIDADTANAATEIVKQVGFPVVVALYFMFKTDKAIERNTEALNTLRDEIHRSFNK